MKEELSRFARHAALIAVTYAVAKGYLPPEVQGPVTDFLTIGVTLLGTLIVSKSSDKKLLRDR